MRSCVVWSLVSAFNLCFFFISLHLAVNRNANVWKVQESRPHRGHYAHYPSQYASSDDNKLTSRVKEPPINTAPPQETEDETWDPYAVSIMYPKYGIKVKVYETLEGVHDLPFWWTNHINTGSWEPHTFLAMSKIINNESLVIDFGAWIGVTVLFSGSIAKHVWALEPNPISFKTLKENVDLNRRIKKHTSLYNECIADKQGQLKLALPIQAGASWTCLDPNGNTIVNCTTLADFIRRERIPIEELDFIKIDCEGCESTALPGILEIFRGLKKKPAISLGVHLDFFINFGQNIEALVKNVEDFVQSYKYAYSPVDGEFMRMPSKMWQMCQLCEVVLSDELIPGL